jgi:hypothetical protein
VGKEGKPTGKTNGGIKMKSLRPSFLAIMVAAAVMGLTGSAFAFHDGGVGACDACHTMHNTLRGVKVTTGGASAQFQGNAFLLIGSDPSSTCLNCHGSGTVLNSFHIATDAAGFNGTTLPVQRTPGGDFSWLKVVFTGISTASGPGTGASFNAPADESKNRHGHHIVSLDYNFLPSTDYITNLSPGGTYPVGSLGCDSCHNPHNTLSRDTSTAGLPVSGSGSYGAAPAPGTSVGVYRLLAGINYTIPIAGGLTSPAFINAAPTAVAPVTYNAVDNAVTTQVRVAYGTSMSEWCANCHLDIYNAQADASTTHRHVASNVALLTTPAPDGTVPATVYNAYINSGHVTGGTVATSYLALVPYELGVSDIPTLLTYAQGGAQIGVNAQTGPSLGSENVMCLSCHRAHASGFDNMMRFDVAQTFITDPTGSSYSFTSPTLGAVPDSTGYYQAAYYGLPATFFGPSQRVLCNKCHAKD